MTTNAAAPLYWRLLRLQHVRPSGWQRALLVEGMLTVAVVLALADVASAWVLLALPAVAAVIVKGHDLLAGMLPARGNAEPLPPARAVDYLPIPFALLLVLVLRYAVHGTAGRVAGIVVVAALLAGARRLLE